MMGLNIKDFIHILSLTILPSIILLGLILYSDRKSKEPVHLILLCLISGIFTISLSLLLGKIVLPNTSFLTGTLTNIGLTRVVILAVIEEYSKLLVLYLFISHNKNFDDIYDGFVYSSLIALSFAVIETVIYVFNQSTIEGMSHLSIIRNLSSIPLHLVCGITMGYYIALERFSKVKKKKVIKIIESLLIPVLLHSAYNFFFTHYIDKINNNPYLLIIVIFVILFIYALGIVYIVIIKRLNKIFIEDGVYDKHYNYLYTKDEYDKLGGEVNEI